MSISGLGFVYLQPLITWDSLRLVWDSLRLVIESL